MVTVAKRRDPQTCDVCEEPSEKVYAFGELILGLDLRTGDQIEECNRGIGHVGLLSCVVDQEGDTISGMHPFLTRIDHVGIAVPDLDAAIEFYGRAFGLSVIHEEVNEEQGVREAMLGGGASVVLEGQRVLPAAAASAGFRHAHVRDVVGAPYPALRRRQRQILRA